MQWLINLFTGDLLSTIGGWITSYMTARSNAQIAETQAGETVAVADTKARTEIVKSEVTSPLLQWPRFLIEMSLATYLVKFWVFDKVVCRFHDFGSACITDAIYGDAGTWAGYVLVGMFGASITDRIMSKWTGR